jgi:hypothetical protein
MTEKFDRYKGPLTSRPAYLIYGLLAGVLLILGIRFFTYHPPQDTHYHANFGVYINGTRETFKDPQYYEEVNICNMKGVLTPQARTHMHNEEAGVIHVHDDGVTWGQFFENLGWVVGPDFIRTRDALYTADDTHKLNIMLNGENLTGLTTITNQVIGDKDRLLLSYGDVDMSTLGTEYKTVPNNAAEYNTRPDPASCAGSHHDVTISDRLSHLF